MQRGMIVIIDYGVGNLGSIVNMLTKIGTRVLVSSNAAIIGQAEKLILPGVGAFDQGMKNINDLGILPLLTDCVIKNRIPILGKVRKGFYPAWVGSMQRRLGSILTTHWI
jgi:glutamine amidotransferase